MKATIRLEHDLVAFEGDHDVHAMLEIIVPEPDADVLRAPLALALVIDRSGSMHGDKLAYATRSAEWLAGRLHATDLLAIVDYDDEVRVIVPLTPVTADHAQSLRSIRPGGQTNLSGGWLKGLEQLQPAEGIRKILLLTDGLANVGITDTSTLVGLAAGARGEGIGTTTIGFGDGFNEDLLTAMADAGGGNGHYAETADAAPAIFATVLVLTAARARDEAIRLADAGRYEEGQQVLHSTLVKLRDAGLSEQADLLAPEIVALESYDASVRKRLHFQSQRQRRGKQT
jgi:Ca-activated chloride channel homolog